MANSTPLCAIRSLALIAYASGFSMYQYKNSSHTTVQISAEGYFNAARDFLAPGDLIIIQGSDSTSQVIAAKTEAGSIIVSPLMAASGSGIIPGAAIADLALTDQGATYDQTALNASLSGIEGKLNTVIAALRTTNIINS